MIPPPIEFETIACQLAAPTAVEISNMSAQSVNENLFCDAFDPLAEIIVWPLQREAFDVDCDRTVALFAKELLKVFTCSYNKFRMYVNASFLSIHTICVSLLT